MKAASAVHELGRKTLFAAAMFPLVGFAADVETHSGDPETADRMLVAQAKSSDETLKGEAKTAKENQATDLPPILVTGEDYEQHTYNVPDSFSATKTDTPIMETPVSIQVIPRAVIDDQKAASLTQALQNVSSVRPQSSVGVFNGFIIRGFTDFNQFRNGLRVNFSDFDTANLERLEVLKGPAAVLFGRIEPGGLINMVTKQARADSYYSLEQQFGSYDFYRTLWDATGAITDDENLQYRFAGAYQNNGSFREFHHNEQFQIYTGLTWHLADSTDITVDVEGFNKDFQTDQGLPAIGDRPAPIPITRSLQDPNDPTDNVSNVFLDFKLTHRFNEDWTLRSRFLAHYRHFKLFDTVVAFFDASALRPDNRTLDRTLFFQESDRETYATNLDLTGRFDLWETEHEVLVGFDYLQSPSTILNLGDFGTADPALAIDIFNPTTLIDPARFQTSLLPVDSYQSSKEEWFGVYFQDQITLWEDLHILGGGRYDWASVGRGRSVTSFSDAENNRRNRNDQAFSPRVGILYQPWSWMSVYGNWVRSFGANNGLSATGQQLDPEIAEQYEAGIKTAFFDDRLRTTLAYYEITKENILTADLSTPDPSDRTTIGRARSKGVELDLAGQVTEDVSVIGNYAYTDARIINDNSGLQGNTLSNVPKHSGSLWLKYDQNGTGSPEGLSLGIGMFAAGQRQGDLDNTFQLPGYVRLDALAAYRLKLGSTMLTTQLNVRNLLDKTYYESTDPFVNAPPRLAIFPGEPLTLIGSVRLEF